MAARPQTYDETFITRLQTSLKASRKIQREALAHRSTILEQFTGSHFGRITQEKRPINKVQQAIIIHSRLLSAKNPAIMLRTDTQALKQKAMVFEQTMNVLLREVQFDVETRLAVLDALMSWGMSKVGLAPAGFVKVGDFLFDPGQPYCQRISPDYCFLDLHARNWSGMQYVGDLNLRNFEDMQAAGKYKNLEKLDPQNHSQQENGQQRAEAITKPKQGPEDRIYDEIEVVDLWLPRDNTILTLSYPDYLFLGSEEYDGPERGPYEMLGLADCPDSILPLPPAQAWVDLDELVNRLVRKIGRQAERQKTVLAYHGSDKEDARRIINANDGESLRIDNPNVQNSTKEIRFGGPEATNLALIMTLLQQVNSLTGNIESLAGISPQSSTVGQDQLLAQQAGTQIDDMRARVVSFSTECIKKLAWYRWNHPSNTAVTLTAPGTTVEYQDTFGPMNREGDLLDYQLSIQPYSMQPQSPQGEYKKLQELLQSILMPLAPVFQQAGVTFDAHALTKLMARYNDIKDLDSILQAAPPPPPPGMGGGMGEPPGKPPVTTRNYVRENRPTSVPRTENSEMAKMLMGAGMNRGPQT
jgi:hypothetical protein